MQLSREEFWALDTTIQWNCFLPLPYLNRLDADVFFNKRRHHGLSTNEVVDLILCMQKRGDLVLFRKTDDMFSEQKYEHPPRSPGDRTVLDFTSVWKNQTIYSKAAIFEDFSIHTEYERRNKNVPHLEPERYPKEILMYCASVQGAEKWETTAQVDWNKYIDCSAGWIDDADLADNQAIWHWRAAAPSEQVLDAYFDWKLRWGAHPDSWETSSIRRYHTERIAPWKATYWKTFPEGFECDFTEYTVRRERMNKEESIRHRIFEEQSWSEHHALFDWCNQYVRDFPFEDD